MHHLYLGTSLRNNLESCDCTLLLTFRLVLVVVELTATTASCSSTVTRPRVREDMFMLKMYEV